MTEVFRLSGHIAMPISGPGFTTPVFTGRTNSFWLQDFRTEERIDNFLPLDPDANDSVTSIEISGRIRHIGEPVIFGFQISTDQVVFGTRKELALSLIKCFSEIENRPNTRRAIANFLQHEELLAIARNGEEIAAPPHKSTEEYSNQLSHFLPLIHIADTYNLAQIARTNLIQAQRDEITGRNLVYLFYGRPAFRLKESHNIWQDPSIIALKPEELPKPYSIYPFDSGSTNNNNGRFVDDAGFAFDGLAINTTADALARIASLSYANSRSYMDEDPTKNKVTSGEKYNNIEIAYNHSIDLSPDKIELVIIPQSIMTDETIRKFIESNNIQIRTYDRFAKHNIGSVGNAIDILTQYYREKGLI